MLYPRTKSVKDVKPRLFMIESYLYAPWFLGSGIKSRMNTEGVDGCSAG